MNTEKININITLACLSKIQLQDSVKAEKQNQRRGYCLNQPKLKIVPHQIPRSFELNQCGIWTYEKICLTTTLYSLT